MSISSITSATTSAHALVRVPRLPAKQTPLAQAQYNREVIQDKVDISAKAQALYEASKPAKK